jgi:hypothetical protein
MPPRDHQAVPRRHRIGTGDAQRQFVLQQHPATGLKRAEDTTLLVALAGIAAEAEGLQVAEDIATAIEPLIGVRRATSYRGHGCILAGGDGGWNW